MLLAKVYDHIKTTVTYQYTVAKMSYVLGLLAGVRPKDFILMTDEDKIFYVHKPLFDYSNQLLDQESKNTLKPLFDYSNQLLDQESKNTLKPLFDSSLPIEYTVLDINLPKLDSFSLLDVESKHATLFIIEDGDGNYVVKGYVDPWYVTPLTAEDFLSLHFIKPFSDQIISSDVPYKNNQKPLSDYLTFTDYSILNYTINYNDYVNVSEYEIKNFNKVNLDDVQLLDTNPIFINKTIVEPVLINESIRISLIKSPIYDTQSITDTPYKNPLLKIIETGDGTYVEIGYFETGYISPLTAYDSTPQLSIT